MPFEAVIPVVDNTLNEVTASDIRGVTTVRHLLEVPDPETGLVLVSVYPSENATLVAYLAFDEIATEDEFFINLTV